MLKIDTLRFGILEINEEKIITFKDGIPGFPESKRFVMIDHKNTPLKWLQSLDDPNLAFIIAESSIVEPKYNVIIDETVRNYLKIEDTENILVFLILRVENGKVVANFNGPLVFNADKMLGVQVIIDKV